MIHRSQDEHVEALADRILADERAASATMDYFEAQMRPRGGPLRRGLSAVGRAIVRGLASAAVAGEPVAGDGGTDYSEEELSSRYYLGGWPWPW
jgi:hypothetical protein